MTSQIQKQKRLKMLRLIAGKMNDLKAQKIEKFNTTLEDGRVEVVLWIDTTTGEIDDSSVCDWHGNEVMRRKKYEEQALEQYESEKFKN